MIASINKTKELLQKYDLQAKKKFGQNFLIDSNVVKKIVACASIDKNTTVIEIGPGLGSMTELLCESAKKVICFEIDHDMVNILTNELDCNNLEIIESDFLKIDLNNYIKENNRVIVVSNLPYYVTTPIITKILEDDIVSEIYVMVQDEVADRFVGLPGNKDYGSITVLINYYSDAKYEFKVSRNCFYPSPNVDSAIVSMKKSKKDYSLNNESNFLKFVQDIFSMRRKTLINNIINKYPIKREKIEAILKEIGLDTNIRSENLNLDKIVKLYKKLDI